MKFMMMMHTPTGGPYQIASWPSEDIKAHIAFMMRFGKKLSAAGELVGAEGLSGPDQAKLVRAGAIGARPCDVRIEFAKGRSIAEVATARGVPVDTVVAAVVADASAKLDRAVADGQTTALAADRFKTRLPRWATRMVHGRRGDMNSRRTGAFG